MDNDVFARLPYGIYLIGDDCDIDRYESREVARKAALDYTSERPAYQAKSRWPLDDEILVGADPARTRFHEQLTEVTEGAYQHV